MTVKLIAGLGNPGKKYEKTRHNVGFLVINQIANNFQFSIFNFQLTFGAQIAEGTINGQKALLAKPQTFMNDSGETVKKIADYYKIKPEDIWIVHDDIDLPLGEFKISRGQGSAGHKGVQSVINELGTKEFNRVRLGICPKQGKPANVEDFVLQKFSREEKETIEKALEDLLKSDLNNLFKSDFNKLR